MTETRIRVQTHEVIIHSQIAAIQSALDRAVVFDIVLNQKGAKSTLEFSATEQEISRLKNDMGYNVLVQLGDRWTPHI